MTGGRLKVAVAIVVLSMGLASVGCTDATEAYCSDLAKMKDLKSLVGALDDKDLDGASEEAQELKGLADRAPEDIRADMQALAQSVLDIIELLEKDREQASVSTDSKGPTSEVEQLRNGLNRRFDELDRRSARVNRWVSENCGLNLS